jgi:hypothetical protein
MIMQEQSSTSPDNLQNLCKRSPALHVMVRTVPAMAPGTKLKGMKP